MNTSNRQTSVLYFNGIDDKIDVQYNRELNPESFTIEAWAKSEQTPDMDRSVVTSRPASYRWGYMIYQAPAFGKWEFWILDRVGQYLKLRGEQVQLGVWTHLAATYDAASRTARFYVNGKQATWSLDGVMVDKITLSEYTPKPTLGPAHGEGTKNLLRIGAGSTESGYCSGGNYFFKGNIDEVRIWNKARSQAEIQAEMNRRLTGTEANLAGYWRLTDVSGNQVLDLAPNKLNGNICKGSMQQQTIDLPSGLAGKTPEPPIVEPPVVEPPIVCPPKPLQGQIIVPSNAINGVDFTNPTDRELTFTFSPSGNWKAATWADCTAAGWKDFAYQYSMQYPNNNSFALLAVNKQTNTVVAEVAVEMTIVLKPGETLTFLVNDIPTCYDDNIGSLVVTWSAQ